MQRVGPDTIQVTGMPAARVGDVAFAAGVRVHELAVQRTGLEDVFFALTADTDSADNDDRPVSASGTGG